MTNPCLTRIITPDCDEWPDLGTLADAPTRLWVRGEANLREATARSVTIVGARAASAYGEYAAADWAYALAADGLSVISGGDYGIAAAAHRGALAGDGVTVAVLGCGLDADYPAGHHMLFRVIVERGGLLVSAYPPQTPPGKTRLAKRNRVLAALSAGVVVVEADQRCGAVNTARHAAEVDKPVMAIPSPITATTARATNDLIRAGTATLVTSVEDVRRDTGLSLTDAHAADRPNRTHE